MKFPIAIPTYEATTMSWGRTDFATREAFLDFLTPLFKEPGQYAFDEDTFIFNFQAKQFKRNGFYCVSPRSSADYREFWDFEKEKCRAGVIIKGRKTTWYLPRDYYMWLNFLPIFNKEIGEFGFADLRDAQYHMAMYECIAEYSYKHAAILKKRQIASSYFHAGKMINYYWFEEGAVIKMAASLKDFINEEGTWRFLEEYRNFLNEHTAWYRPSNPDKVLNWQQKIEVSIGGRKRDVGNKSVIIGLGLDKSPSKGVGGPCKFFFHEEAGIAPKMNDTLEFLLPALKSGMIYTGMFAVAGSVGDLDQCEPLKELILNPDSKDVLSVRTDLVDDKGTIGMCGLFIPEQWSMPPCIDEFGNSDVEAAVKMIDEEREVWRKSLRPQDYRLRISQKPKNIEEAFAFRKESVFPQHLVTNQIRRIEDREYPTEYVELSRNEVGKVIAKESKKLPIIEFPLSPRTTDKSGVICVYERPLNDAPWQTYYASVDPVGVGKTTTSDSLCSIYIYKNPIEIVKHKADGTIEHIIERDKIVASWCGRFDDIKLTHERLEMMIEWYNAWTIVENNVSEFITYMIGRRKQKYLVPKNQIAFLKDLGANLNVYQEYGWRNVGTVFKSNILNYGISFLQEEIDHEVKGDGEIVRTTYGVERIPDIMLLREMQAYHDKLNVDRIVAFSALVAFAKVQQSNRGVVTKTEREEGAPVQMSQNFSKLKMNPFRHLGQSNTGLDQMKKSRTPFRNLR